MRVQIRIGPQMRRFILNLLGAALLAVPVLLALFGANSGLTTSREQSATAGMPESLSLLVTAGAYILHWGSGMLGAFLIFCANRRHG